MNFEYETGPTTTRQVLVEERGEEWYRQQGLAEAVAYFSYVRRQAPDAPPVGAVTVMEMADHFANYIRSGEKPEAKA